MEHDTCFGNKLSAFLKSFKGLLGQFISYTATQIQHEKYRIMLLDADIPTIHHNYNNIILFACSVLYEFSIIFLLWSDA